MERSSEYAHAIIEGIKFVLRMAILYAPLILAFILDWQDQGMWFAISTALAALDKGIHKAPVRAGGLIGF